MANIRKEFISLLDKVGKQEGLQCKRYESRIRDTNNILELSGSIICLLYFKIRSEAPYRWGVTKIRVEELESLGKKWFIVLLYESPDNGYLLSSDEVRRYIREGLWPLGRGKNKNEYKIGPTKTLRYNRPFKTFGELIKSLEVKISE